MTAGGWVDVTWIDLLGRPRAIRVRSEDLRNGIDLEVRRADVLAGFGAPPEEEGIVRVVPDWSTSRPVPWEDNLSIVMADLYEPDGQPSALCSRTALRRVLARAEDLGYRLAAAAELEFFLLNPENAQPIYPEIECYSIVKGSELEPVLREVRNQLRLMDIPIEASNPEYSGGQVEVNIAHGDALLAADRATLFRSMVRLLARRAGLDATFMAKPWTDQAGNGMHVHQSLWRGEENVFFERDRLSAVARRYIAGLLARIREFALFGSPTPNGYHRRADYSFAPTAVSWGSDNRTVAVRYILTTPEGTRVEQRDASADCNIYLVFAGQFAAGIDGITSRLEPPPPTKGNAYATPGLDTLPFTFFEAYDRLSSSDAARRLVGEETVEAYLAVLRAERDVLLSSSADWERERYMAWI